MKKTSAITSAIIISFLFVGCNNQEKIILINKKIIVPKNLLSVEKIPRVPKIKNEKNVSIFTYELYKKLKKQNNKTKLIKDIIKKYNKEVRK